MVQNNTIRHRMDAPSGQALVYIIRQMDFAITVNAEKMEARMF